MYYYFKESTGESTWEAPAGFNAGGAQVSEFTETKDAQIWTTNRW